VTHPLLHLKSNFFLGYITIFVFLDLLPHCSVVWLHASPRIHPDNVLTPEAVTISYIRSCYWTGLLGPAGQTQVHIISSVLPSRSWWLTSSSSSTEVSTSFECLQDSEGEDWLNVASQQKTCCTLLLPPLSHSSQSLERDQTFVLNCGWVGGWENHQKLIERLMIAASITVNG
jgi:hypothetical protein